MARLHSDGALARRLEAADARLCLEFVRILARLRPASAAAALPVAGGQAAYTGVGSPLTQARGLGMSDPVGDADLDRLEEFYRARGVPAAIEVCPLAHPSLAERLGRRGYRVIEFSNTLVRPVAREERPATPPGMTIERMAPADFDLWVRTATLAFFEPDPVPPEYLAVFSLFPHMPETTLFLARIEGEPCGAAAVALTEGVAAFFGTATLGRFRGRGTHAALLAARLAHASAAGCDLAVMGALPGSASQRNAERAGFRVAYTRVQMSLDHRGGAGILLQY